MRPAAEQARHLRTRLAAFGAPVFAMTVFFGTVQLGCERVVLDFDDGASADGVGVSDSIDPPPPEAPEAPELVVDERFDTSRDEARSRDCDDGGDGVAYRVASLRAGRARLTTTPSARCLSVGDELLLIKLQGSPSSIENVGEFELLRVAALEADEVEFVSTPVRHYGEAPGADDGVEAGVVVLQRVPNYSRLEVRPNAVLTSSAWDGNAGGVLALRVLGDVVVDGLVTMSAKGFRGGVTRDEVLAHGVSGESIGGLGREDTAANHGGGGGGLGDRTRSGCVQDGNAGGGGAHRTNGRDASVTDLCEGEGRGRGGVGYAASGRIFFGSGGGSGGVDNVRVDNPPGGAGGAGGGIVWILGQSLTGSGRIEVDGAPGVGDEEGVECQGFSSVDCYDHSGPGGAGAGGTLRLSVPQIAGVTLSVAGGTGGNGFDFSTGNGGEGAPGVRE